MFPPQGSEGLSIVESKESFLLVLPGHHVVVLGLLENPECKLPQLGTGGYICAVTERREEGDEWLVSTIPDVSTL